MPDDPGVGLLVVLGTLRAGEELVPGGEQRGPPVDEDRVVRRGGDQFARTVPAHRGAHVVGEHDLQPVLDLLRRGQALGGAAQQGGDLGVAGGLGALGRGGEQRLALGADQGDVDAGRDLDLGVVHPGLPGVAPALDPEGPGALGLRVTDAVHQSKPSGVVGASARSARAARVGEHHRRVDGVVALAEDGGPDRDRLADRRPWPGRRRPRPPAKPWSPVSGPIGGTERTVSADSGRPERCSWLPSRRVNLSGATGDPVRGSVTGTSPSRPIACRPWHGRRCFGR